MSSIMGQPSYMVEGDANNNTRIAIVALLTIYKRKSECVPAGGTLDNIVP